MNLVSDFWRVTAEDDGMYRLVREQLSLYTRFRSASWDTPSELNQPGNSVSWSVVRHVSVVSAPMVPPVM